MMILYYFAKHYVANFGGQTVWQQTRPGNFQNFPTMAEQMLGLQNRQCRIPEVVNHVGPGPDDVSHCLMETRDPLPYQLYNHGIFPSL